MNGKDSRRNLILNSEEKAQYFLKYSFFPFFLNSGVMIWHTQGVLPLAVTSQTSHISSRIYLAKLSLHPVQNFPKDFLPLALTSRLFGFTMKRIFLKPTIVSLCLYETPPYCCGWYQKVGLKWLQVFPLKEKKLTGTFATTRKGK